MNRVIKPGTYKVIRQEIENKGLKQSFVADHVGVSRTYFSKVLNGTAALTTDKAIKACYILNIPIEKILRKS